MKRCSISLIITEMQSKLQWGIISNRSEWPLSKSQLKANNKSWRRCGEREFSWIVGGNINCYSHYIKQYYFLKKKEKKKQGIKLTYDPVIIPSGICPEETIIEKDTCIPMFIAAISTAASTWKQPRCPLTDECINKLWYIYVCVCVCVCVCIHTQNRILFNQKMEHIWVSSNEVDEPINYYTEWSKLEREKSYIMY